MVKFFVNHTFYGKKEKKRFVSSKEKKHDFTLERAEEINKTMEEEYDLKNTLERANPPKKEKKSESDADDE